MSSAILDAFQDAIRRCYNVPLRRFKRKALTVGVLDSKGIGQQLVGRYGTFRTESCQNHRGCPFLRGGSKPCRECRPITHGGIAYPPASLPPFETDGEVSAFLQAAFSCDGGVNLYVARRGTVRWLIRNVYLACKHPTLLSQYSSLLTRLGVNNQVMKADWRVLVQGKRAIDCYAQKVGFIPGVTVGGNSKFWQGETKSRVLGLLLESYGNPQPILDLPWFSLENVG